MYLSRTNQPNELSTNVSADIDVRQYLLQNTRSNNTKRAYAKDLDYFFETMAGTKSSIEIITQFLQLDRREAIAIVLKYKSICIEKGLSEATINRRLSAIKALVKMAFTLDKCRYTLEEIKGEKLQTYRDTSGVDRETYKKVLSLCDLSTLKGKRDYALLRLLWDNALRDTQ